MYIHIPFCIHRCGYCDFNTYAGLQGLIPVYTQAVCKELEVLSLETDEKLSIHTVFFGGGTPSLLNETELESIIDTIDQCFIVEDNLEISLEANPGTVSLEYLKNIHRLGINRLSLGMQSANPGELQMLERQHSFEDVIQAVDWARAGGIDNLNLDLIYGLPWQTVGEWIKSINAAISLKPEHLSLYALTIEHGTPMQKQVESELMPKPDDDLAADMYDASSGILAEAGYEQYEISNWAKRNQVGEFLSCMHNLQYWRNLPYLGVGAGAHGFINNHRTIDVMTPGAYIQRMGTLDTQNLELDFPATPATIQNSYIDTETEIGETMMMGLRLVKEGVSSEVFQKRFGINLYTRFQAQIDRFIDVGLLEWDGQDDKRLRLTSKGYLLGNQVFMEFI